MDIIILTDKQILSESFEIPKKIYFAVNKNNYNNEDDLYYDIEIIKQKYNKNKIIYQPFLLDFKNEYALTIYRKDFPPNKFKCNSPCEYHRNQLKLLNQITYGKGFKNKPIIIGEAPGYKGCAITGIPFYRDKSGMLLRQSLFNLGFNPDIDFYITNVLKCNPPLNQLTFSQKKINDLYCIKNLLISEINQSNGIIICCGKIAFNTINFLSDKINIKNLIFIKHPASYLYQYKNYLQCIKFYSKYLEQELKL